MTPYPLFLATSSALCFFLVFFNLYHIKYISYFIVCLHIVYVIHMYFTARTEKAIHKYLINVYIILKEKNLTSAIIGLEIYRYLYWLQCLFVYKNIVSFLLLLICPIFTSHIIGCLKLLCMFMLFHLILKYIQECYKYLCY